MYQLSREHGEAQGGNHWYHIIKMPSIPFADFLNHDGLSEAVVLHDEDKQLSEVIADRDYAPKEKVWITYGKFPNSTLLLDFGFSLPYNSHNEGAALSFKYYQYCFSSMNESVVLPSYELS
ncbi:hypothetical protein WN944_024136 [Citrus x changshan-huyou]|uniref:SET domain-containing protein n=1 Tax=Citrus x changshan-huyou TaxID=2935761 RepID=A0AAP0LMF3_9ROSI